MWVALPAADKSLDSVIASMDAETLGTWQRATRERKGTFKMPRFTIKFKTLLNEPLKQLGMERAFSDTKAQFDPMGKSHMGPLYINRVLHEAVVIVTEEGTEAAAATVVEMGARSAPPAPFNMTCDRPFFFWIADERTGAVLFAGTVYNPANPE
jgi:serpin B